MSEPGTIGTGITRGPGKRVPAATCRLQFNRGFTFEQARAIVDYLHDLGISDLYASPLFQASADSTHGYDVCDYGSFHPALGTREHFEKLSQALCRHGMGLLLDVVPNHMQADLANCWWADVLEKGQRSRHAQWFDIDWNPPDERLRGKVLLPVLGADLSQVLRAGELRVIFEGNGFYVSYYSHRFPLSLECYADIFREIGDLSPEADRKDIVALCSAVERLIPLPGDVTESFDAIKRQFATLLCSSLKLSRVLENVLQCVNGLADAARPVALTTLLSEQHYQLTYWKTGLEKINYRRFFDVSGLVCLNVQNPAAFAAAHQFLQTLLLEGKVTGLRVDHPDGLWDPKTYFEKLQQLSTSQNSLYVVAEKILSGDELLPADWPVDGTTGYDFLNQLNGLFVDFGNKEKFDHFYKTSIGMEAGFAAVVETSKRQILQKTFSSETRSLAHRLHHIAAEGQQAFTIASLEEAIREVIVAFPVYRTYITEKSVEPSPIDQPVIHAAVERASWHLDSTGQEALALLRDVLLLRREPRQKAIDFVMRFQQLTGPAMAKGLEDTAFYRFNRLVSLNEVGGEPGRFGHSVEHFHQHNCTKAKHWPHSLLATTTHDTKHGEDFRARLNVLSEMPDPWFGAVQVWQEWNATFKTPVNGVPAPDANDEYLLYQTLIGAWPAASSAHEPATAEFRERIVEYMLKANREAKLHTSWTEQNIKYETATALFVRKILEPSNARFLQHFVEFQRTAAFFGQFNSYSQLLLKTASPGVPDFYQGTELWDFSLVDPDNRRPVDYRKRIAVLNDLKSRLAKSGSEALIRDLLSSGQADHLKLYLTWLLLNFRKQHSQLFQQGNYVPLKSTGTKATHVVAFAREFENAQVIVIAPRLIAGLTGGRKVPPTGQSVWKDTLLRLPSAFAVRYRNILTDQIIEVKRGDESGLAVAEALSEAPVTLLERL